jgi:nucleotide-binding universal stress UspA family protein
MIKAILVGLSDERYSRSATAHAIQLARRHDALLTGVTLYDPDRLDLGPVPLGAGESARALREHRDARIREVLQVAVAEFAQACQASQVPHEVIRETGNACESMISASRYHDVIICGLRHLFAHGVVEEPPVELVRMVEGGVRPLIAVAEEFREIQRVLIAYSGSTESAKTMKRFVQFRHWPDAALRIVSFDQDRSAAEERLARAQRYCQLHGFAAETEFVQDDAVDSLLPYARGWNADLIVMGNSARRLLIRRLFGETVLHVVANTDRPLFMSM